MPGTAKTMAEKNNKACLEAGMNVKEYRRNVKINVSHYLFKRIDLFLRKINL